jgi:tetratricopeptide (TPR) repeat protein
MPCDPISVAVSNSKDRRSAARRLGALAVGLGILLLVELLLRVVGFGGPGQRPDPFAGFATSEPLFVAATAADGTPTFRTRPDRIGQFNLQEFPRMKSPGTIRLFCLGGSSTFGFPYDARLSFCAAVERSLKRQHPEKQFEVINCGGMSYGARRVLNVMRELTSYEADGFLVYMGHNEYVERRFFAPFLNEASWRRGLRATLNRLRVYVAVRRALAPLTRKPSQPTENLFGAGAPARDDSLRLARDPREDALVEEQFRFVVTEMEALAGRAGSELFLILPAANLRDWAPEGSMWNQDLSPQQTRQRDEALAAATQRHQSGHHAEALVAIDRVLELDPMPAAAHFLRGQILLALQQPGAHAALQRARDLDAVPIRITGNLASIIRDAWSRGSLEALDAEEALAAASPDGVVGSDMVLDYCHPSPEGHRRIAAITLPVLLSRFWPDQPAPPIAFSQLVPPGGEGPDAASSAFGAAWAGQMLLRQGRVSESEALFRRSLELDAEMATAHEGLGRILAGSGRTREAVEELQEAARLAPQMSNVWNNLGQAYRAAGRLEDALEAYRRAAAAGGPGAGVVHRNLAATLARLGRLEEALEEALTASRVSPGDALAWVQLAEIHTSMGHLEKAREAYEHALALDPAGETARRGLEALATPQP